MAAASDLYSPISLPGGKLCLMIVYDRSPDIAKSIDVDINTLRTYFTEKERICNDLELVIKPTSEIASYDHIFHHFKDKSRVIFWYVGHGLNLSGDFPTFEGNDIYIEQQLLHNRADDNYNLFVSVFDCCNKRPPRLEEPILNIPKERIASMFDFVGKLAICSSSSGQKSWCSDEEGGQFTHFFCNKFTRTYDQTFEYVSKFMDSDPFMHGKLVYHKFETAVEPIPQLTDPLLRQQELLSLMNQTRNIHTQ